MGRGVPHGDISDNHLICLDGGKSQADGGEGGVGVGIAKYYLGRRQAIIEHLQVFEVKSLAINIRVGVVVIAGVLPDHEKLVGAPVICRPRAVLVGRGDIYGVIITPQTSFAVNELAIDIKIFLGYLGIPSILPGDQKQLVSQVNRNVGAGLVGIGNVVIL